MPVGDFYDDTRKELFTDMHLHYALTPEHFIKLFADILISNLFKDGIPTGEVIHHSVPEEHMKLLWFDEVMLGFRDVSVHSCL